MNGYVTAADIEVNGSDNPTFANVGETITFDISVDGVCRWVNRRPNSGPPKARFKHTMQFGDGSVTLATARRRNTRISHAYSSSGTFFASDTVRCSCTSLFSSTAVHTVTLQATSTCSDAIRLAYHAENFRKNNIFQIRNTGIIVDAVIKVKPGPGASFSTFADGARSHWNKSFSTGVLSFDFEEVGQFYFGNDALNVDVEFFPPDVPERGSAIQGGRDLIYALDATTQVIAHEFGHILGFRNAYTKLASGYGKDLVCHTADVMATASGGKTVRKYHAALLVDIY